MFKFLKHCKVRRFTTQNIKNPKFNDKEYQYSQDPMKDLTKEEQDAIKKVIKEDVAKLYSAGLGVLGAGVLGITMVVYALKRNKE